MYVKPITFRVVGRSKKSWIVFYMKTSIEILCQSNAMSLTGKILIKVACLLQAKEASLSDLQTRAYK